MEKSPALEGNRHSVKEPSPRPLRSTNVHYQGHKSPPLEPVLRHLDRVHTLPFYFFNTNFNINLPSTFASSTDLFPLGYQKKIYEIWYKL
jgi:hypothetical protein